ncbi:MAG: FliH/SctL family protein [Gemmatimonadota bacterium]
MLLNLRQETAGDAGHTPNSVWHPFPVAVIPMELESADRQAQRQIDAAYAKGRSDGIAEGERTALSRIEPLLGALHRMVASVQESQATTQRDAERDIQSLALAAARYLVQREITSDPSILQSLVERALEQLPQDTSFTVHLNPTDLGALQPNLGDIHVAERGAMVRWVPDPELERGDFRLVTPLRLIDGRIDTALRALYDRIAYE